MTDPLGVPYALGRRPHDPDRPRLRLRDFVHAVPEHPLAVDDSVDVEFGLDGNDAYGVCVPTGKDNMHRAVSRLLTGTQVSMTQDEVFADYRSQNPHFNPITDVDDNGMVIQQYLEFLTKRGDILGFAAVDVHDVEEVRAATYLFTGLLLGVDLHVAQQAQTSAGRWSYVPNSPDWGGHCVFQFGYGPSGQRGVTWQVPVELDDGFWSHQVDEAWVVIFEEHVRHPDFRAGFDLVKFARAYQDVTGRPFPIVPTPEPPPTPVPPVPGGDGWFQLRPAVAAALRHAAVRRGVTDAEELDHILSAILRVR